MWKSLVWCTICCPTHPWATQGSEYNEYLLFGCWWNVSSQGPDIPLAYRLHRFKHILLGVSVAMWVQAIVLRGFSSSNLGFGQPFGWDLGYGCCICSVIFSVYCYASGRWADLRHVDMSITCQWAGMGMFGICFDWKFLEYASEPDLLDQVYLFGVLVNIIARAFGVDILRIWSFWENTFSNEFWLPAFYFSTHKSFNPFKPAEP